MNHQSMTNLEAAIVALQFAGADGIILLREAEAAAFHFAVDGSGEQVLVLNRPHDLIILVRFSTSDGGEPGIEHR